MPDITMCYGTDCAEKNNCYRYTAIPNQYRQSYSYFHPGFDEHGQRICKEFIPAHKEKEE